MKYSIWFAMLVLAACSGGGDGPGGTSAAKVQGKDLSGTYRPTQVGCFTASGAVTGVANLSGPNSTVTIQGNSFVANGSTQNCNFTETAQITFDSASSQVTISNLKVTTLSQGGCSFTTSLNQVSGSQISPTSNLVTYSNGELLNTVNSTYIVDSQGNLFLSTSYHTANSSDLCFIEYQKI